MGFPFGSKGENPVQGGDLLQVIPCRMLATNSAAAAHSLLFLFVIRTIWVADFEEIREKLA